MSNRFKINVTSTSYFDGIETSEVVFHAMNKVGSLAMGNTIAEAFESAGLSSKLLSHYKIGGTSDDFYEMVKSKKSKLVVGHKLYGALEPRKDRIWFTQFRHPLPKLLSSYNWLKIKHEKKNNKPFKTLKDFVLGTKGAKHCLVQQFGHKWELFKQPFESSPNARSLYLASLCELEKNIHTLTLAEKFEESLFIVARLCGLPSLAPWFRDIRNPGRKLSHEISDEERDVIMDVYFYDYELYNYAVNRFNKQLQQINFGDNLEEYKQVCIKQYNDRILIV